MINKTAAKRRIVERLSERLEKQAGPRPRGGVSKSGLLKNILLGSGILAGAGALLGIGGAAADKAYEATVGKSNRTDGYNSMLARYPSLKKLPKQAVKDRYDTLWQFSPQMAKNPLTASSYIKRSMEYETEGVQPPDIKLLTDIQKGYTDKERNKVLRRAFDPSSAGSLLGFASMG